MSYSSPVTDDKYFVNADEDDETPGDDPGSEAKKRKLRPVNRGAQACNECRGHKVRARLPRAGDDASA
jgi:hypothetical protein